MHSATATGPRSGHLVIGVDTHKDLHVAACLDTTAGLMGTLTITADTAGFAQLLDWATTQGQVIAAGVEGTGCYGQTLTAFLRRQGITVVEVNRADRAERRRRGKSDTIDAINAARAVLAHTATATPKTADGTAEALRRLNIAYNTAVKARTEAMNAIKGLLVTADETLRAECRPLRGTRLTDKLARLRPRNAATPADAARTALRSLARRWKTLDQEAVDLAQTIADLVGERAPHLLAAFGIGPHTAAQILISVGDNPDRIHSEAALAKLAGTCPIPAGSGKTDGRHRLYRGGDRQLNAALHHTVLIRLQFHPPTRAYLDRRTREGRTKKEIIRCLKRYLAREIYRLLQPQPLTSPTPT